jgi:heptaprenyl diphosphate synthase
MVSIAAAVGDVEAHLGEVVDRLRASPEVADRAMGEFIAGILADAAARGSTGIINTMARLPLLVHGAESGDPAGGRDAAVIHLLWWTSARFFDDLADGGPTMRSGFIDRDRGILAALGAGTCLPIRLIATAGVSDAAAVRLIRELSRGWLDGIGGQLLDYSARVTDTDLDTVLRSYRGKTGAPYGMATAMAAHLAGAGDGRTDRWREVGVRLGVLRQLVNDQRDLVTGRDEDLKNGTGTYLVVRSLAALPAERRARMLALHAAAAGSAQARQEFKEWLLAPEAVRGYHAAVDAMVAQVHSGLDDLGGDPVHVEGLHDIVHETMRAFPLPTAA